MDLYVDFEEIYHDPSVIAEVDSIIVIDDWKLDKPQTSHNDILDSFRLALCNYEPPKNWYIK